VADYQFSLLHELDQIGRIEYRAFDDDAAALRYAQQLLGDFDKVTVYEGPRIVGLIVHPRNQIRT
jgi:hypothetical protein